MNILVIKKKDNITISHNGKRLFIDKNNILFNQLNILSKEEIQKWYIEKGVK